MWRMTVLVSASSSVESDSLKRGSEYLLQRVDQQPSGLLGRVRDRGDNDDPIFGRTSELGSFQIDRDGTVNDG